MSVLLVTYDLNREAVRPNITKRLKEGYPTWAKLSESCYAIKTANTPRQVQDFLRPMLDANDVIYVITLNAPYSGWGPKEVNEWLATNLLS
ncbi:hypothetical protein [Sphingomonas sp. 3-13AW]|uniref:hypothetical protein n=1 Tax=Sphingomonas sp. 3-13AW TaxID=3050450 RepID=UPI003BB5ABEB